MVKVVEKTLINILVSINRAYVPQLKTMLHSLYLNNLENEIKVHLLHSELDGEDIRVLTDTVQRYGGTLSPYLVNEEQRKTAAISDEFPPEAFYRLFCLDYLPGSIKRVLYLDSDLIVNGSLADLFNLKLTEGAGENCRRYIFAAAADADSHTQRMVRHKQKLGFPPGLEYVNSGVLLMDLDAMGAYVTTAEIIAQIPNYRARLTYPDQDLLNLLFAQNICYLDRYVYNYVPISSSSWLTDLRQGCPAVIHFAGKKPWDPHYLTNTQFRRSAKALYDFYASL